MRTFLILLKKELRSYFLSPFGWTILAFVICTQGFALSTAMKGFREQASQQSLVYVAFANPAFWFWYLALFPLLTMRLFAEEQRSGTLEGLLTAPVRSSQVVLAKYFSAFIFYCILWIPSFIQFRMYEWVTDVPPAYAPGAMLGAYLILFLMGLAFTAIGCFASALTSSQIIAALVTSGILLLHHLLGYVTLIWGSSFGASAIFDHISSRLHLHYFTSGLLDSRPVVYYISLTTLVLFLTYQIVDFRRWRR